MPLDALQEEVASLALHLAEAAHVALAGGGAMLAHEFVDRPTMDLDLFTSDPGEVGPVTDALHKALHERGYAVEVTRREETCSHLQVTAIAFVEPLRPRLLEVTACACQRLPGRRRTQPSR